MTNELEQIKRNAKSIVANAAASGLVSGAGHRVAISKNVVVTPAADVGNIRCNFTLITPDQARLWLNNNIKNRNLREDVVNSYARDMKAGDWLLTHQGIAFNDKEELIDGQHRLHGIVRAGVPVTILVTFGLPSNLLGKKITVMDAVDRGANRTISDQLSLEHGIKDANIVAGVCKVLAKLCSDSDRQSRKLTVSQTLQIFNIYKDSIVFAIAHRPTISSLRTAGVLAGIAFAHAAFPLKTSEHYYKFGSGENLTSESPILALRNRLMTSTKARFIGSTRSPIAEMVLQSLYYVFAEKKNLPQLNFNSVLAGGHEFFSAAQSEKISAVKALFMTVEKPTEVAPSIAPVAKAPTKLTLEQLLFAVEGHSGIARAIIIGRGLDDDVCLARNTFISIALESGYKPAEIAAILKNTEGFVRGANDWLKHYFEHRGRIRAKNALDKFRVKILGKK